MIKVRVWMDRIDCIHGYPVRQDLRAELAQHMHEMTGRADHRFFFQGFGASEFLDSCSTRQKKDLESGFDITILVDPWIMGHWYGWDAHTIFE